MLDGVVNLNVTLPSCAYFVFWARVGNKSLANGHVYRNPTMSYELPEAYAITPYTWREPSFEFGRRMTVRIRPNGPARFIIDHGGSNGIAWFDTP